MPRIVLTTSILASKELVFDLSRSIELHTISTYHTNETAIDGKISGLIEMGEYVTWRAKHFGCYQTLTSKITAFNRPNFFVDEMVKGAFKSFRHEHHFQQSQNTTIMTDYFEYESPLGLLGRIADFLFLKKYITTFLQSRNHTIKHFAESNTNQDIILKN